MERFRENLIGSITQEDRTVAVIDLEGDHLPGQLITETVKSSSSLKWLKRLGAASFQSKETGKAYQKCSEDC